MRQAERGAARRRHARAIALVFALGLPACGWGGGAAAAGSSPPAGTAHSASCSAQSGLTGKVADHGTKEVSDSAVELKADDFFFAPTCAVVAGGALAVSVKNEGSALHNFSITSQGIDRDVQPGQTITVKVRFAGSAPFPFFCKFHVGAGMQGAFIDASLENVGLTGSGRRSA